MLLHSDSNLFSSYIDYIERNSEIIIFSPYIKLNLLEKLAYEVNAAIKTIVTTWNPIDFLTGVSDVEVFTFCKENGIQLLINNRIHLKCILDTDFTSCIISSANFTNKGLATAPNYNFELGTVVNELTTADCCYFDRIFDTSTLATDAYYDETVSQVEKLSKAIEKIPKEFNRNNCKKQKFLTSELPYFESPKILHEVITNHEKYTDEEIRSAFHDLRLYEIESSIDKDDFKSQLRIHFLEDEFIKEFLRFNGEGKFFGELTTWLHNKIEDVPSPKRFEVKEYQKRLYSYIEYLLEDAYSVDIPKNHSQYLSRKRIVV